MSVAGDTRPSQPAGDGAEARVWPYPKVVGHPSSRAWIACEVMGCHVWGAAEIRLLAAQLKQTGLAGRRAGDAAVAGFIWGTMISKIIY